MIRDHLGDLTGDVTRQVNDCDGIWNPTGTTRFIDDIYEGTSFAYEFARHDGAKLSIQAVYLDPKRVIPSYDRTVPASWAKYAEFAEAAVRSVAAAQFVEARAAIDRHGQVSFHDLVARKVGLEIKSKLIAPWARARVEVERGRVKIASDDKDQPFWNRAIEEVPNFALLLALIDAFRQS